MSHDRKALEELLIHIKDGRAKAHLGPWPHPGGCEECHRVHLCNVCGEVLTSGRCTNGRCSYCHNMICTPGGETSPGHGYGTLPPPREAVVIDLAALDRGPHWLSGRRTT